MNRLNLLMASLLLTIRQTERVRGQTVAEYYRAEHAYRGTPRRRHKITDRAARKWRARWIGFCRVVNPDLGLYADFNLGL